MKGGKLESIREIGQKRNIREVKAAAISNMQSG
jgi:hypothetical protein